MARALSAGLSTQLAAFTLDGSIRAVQRALDKGICHAPPVLWHAYWRWAALQDLEQGSIERPATTSRRCHTLTRTRR